MPLLAALAPTSLNERSLESTVWKPDRTAAKLKAKKPKPASSTKPATVVKAGNKASHAYPSALAHMLNTLDASPMTDHISDEPFSPLPISPIEPSAIAAPPPVSSANVATQLLRQVASMANKETARPQGGTSFRSNAQPSKVSKVAVWPEPKPRASAPVVAAVTTPVDDDADDTAAPAVDAETLDAESLTTATPNAGAERGMNWWRDAWDGKKTDDLSEGTGSPMDPTDAFENEFETKLTDDAEIYPAFPARLEACDM